MSKHSIRIGRLSRLSASRSSSSASTRRSRFASRLASGLQREPCVLARHLLRRRFSPPLGGAQLDSRAAELAHSSRERGARSPASRGTTICGGTLGVAE